MTSSRSAGYALCMLHYALARWVYKRCPYSYGYTFFSWLSSYVVRSAYLLALPSYAVSVAYIPAYSTFDHRIYQSREEKRREKKNFINCETPDYYISVIMNILWLLVLLVGCVNLEVGNSFAVPAERRPCPPCHVNAGGRCVFSSHACG